MKKLKLSLLTSSIILSSTFMVGNVMATTLSTVSLTGSKSSSFSIDKATITTTNDIYTQQNFGNDYYTFTSNTKINIDVSDPYKDLDGEIGYSVYSRIKGYGFYLDNNYLEYSKADANIASLNENIKITDNSALVDFVFGSHQLDGTYHVLYLKIIQAQTVQEAVQSLNVKNINGTNAARTLQNIIDNGNNNGKMDGVINALNKLSSNSDVDKAVSSTTPQTTTSSFTAANQISNNVSNIVTQRQNVNLNGSAGLNSGDELLSDKNLWAKAYGSIGSQDDKDGVNGFDIDTYGVGFGIDGEYADDQKIGLGIFYTNADVDVNNVKQSSDIDVYSFIVYGSFPVIDSKSHLLYQLGYSWQDVDSQRNIEFMGTTAKADYTSKVASIDVRLLRDYQVSDDILVQPLISTTYRYFKSPSYSETGADTLNLNVDSFSSSEFILGLGTLAYYKINDDSKLFGNVNVGYDLKDDDNTVTSSYSGAAGTSFETVGIDNGRWNYDLGFGYENDVSDFSNISFSYNFQGEGTDYTNHILSAKYTYKF